MKGNGQNINELTRIEAFLLSEKAGHPSHMSDYFWSQAEAIVRRRVSIVDIAVKAVGKRKVARAATPAQAKPAAKVKKAAEPELKLKADAAPAVKKPAAVKKTPAAAKKSGTKSK